MPSMVWIKTNWHSDGIPGRFFSKINFDFFSSKFNFEKKNQMIRYSKTCLKQPLKKKTKNWFSRPIIA